VYEQDLCDVNKKTFSAVKCHLSSIETGNKIRGRQKKREAMGRNERQFREISEKSPRYLPFKTEVSKKKSYFRNRIVNEEKVGKDLRILLYLRRTRSQIVAEIITWYLLAFMYSRTAERCHH